jgi:hypothetical protein
MLGGASTGLEVRMSETAWDHRYLEANGLRIHHVRHGSGAPLILAARLVCLAALKG